MNINNWLEERGFGQYINLFEKNGITLDELSRISSIDELKKIGIKSSVDRKSILKKINTLSGNSYSGAAPSSSPKTTGRSQQISSSTYCKSDNDEIQRLYPSPKPILNEYEEAIVKNKKDLKKKIKEHGEDDGEVSDIYYDLGTNYYMNEQYPKAIDYHKKALSIRIACYGEDDVDVVIAYYQLGHDYYYNKNYKQAIFNYKKALDIQIELNEDDDHNEGVAAISFDLGKGYYYDNQYDKAIVSHETALEIRQYVFDENHMDVVDCYYQLGLDYYQDDQYDKAITNHKKALEILLTSTFEDKRKNISNCYYQLGLCYLSSDQYELAITNFKGAIKIRKDLYGNNHMDVAECILGLGKTLSMQNENTEAIENFNMALSIYENESEDEKIAECNASLGISYFEKGQEEKALSHLKIAWKLFVETLGETSNKAQEMKNLIETLEVEVDESPEVETNESNTQPANEESYNEDIEKYILEGDECIENKKYAEALMHYENALKLSNIALKDDEKTETVANINFKLGTTSKHLEEYVEAEEYLLEAISGFVGLHGKNYFDSARSYSQLGDVYYYINDYKNAIINHHEALESYSNLDEESLVAWSHYDLGLDYYWTEDYEQSIDHFFNALDIRLKLYGKMHKQVANCYNRLGLSYYWDNQNEKSIKYNKQALEIREHLFGTESEEFDDSRFALAKAYYYANMEGDAKKYFLASRSFRKKQYGNNSKEYNKAKEWLTKINDNP